MQFGTLESLKLTGKVTVREKDVTASFIKWFADGDDHIDNLDKVIKYFVSFVDLPEAPDLIFYRAFDEDGKYEEFRRKAEFVDFLTY